MTTFQVKFLRILLLMLQGQLFSLCLRNNVEKGKGYLLFTILWKAQAEGTERWRGKPHYGNLILEVVLFAVVIKKGTTHKHVPNIKLLHLNLIKWQ